MARIDIKDPDQLARLHRLIIEHADVFVHNLRPGASSRYGLDAESLRDAKAELIHCEIGAFGHLGPLNDRPGYDPLMQAFAGIMNLTGEEGQPPVRAGVSIVDFGSGMWAAIGILTALYRRQASGGGATVNGSLLETAIAWMTVGIANYNVDGEPGGRYGSGAGFIVPHRAYAAADGYLALGAANDSLFARLCRALDRPEWAVDDRFSTNAARLKHRADIDGLIGERIATASRAYWLDRLESHGIPVAPVQTTAELVAHEQTRALGIMTAPPDDDIEMVGLPLSFDGDRPHVAHGARDIGQDDDQLSLLLGQPMGSPRPIDH
jgi:formyl-CoA transferase